MVQMTNEKVFANMKVLMDRRGYVDIAINGLCTLDSKVVECTGLYNMFFYVARDNNKNKDILVCMADVNEPARRKFGKKQAEVLINEMAINNHHLILVVPILTAYITEEMERCTVRHNKAIDGGDGFTSECLEHDDIFCDKTQFLWVPIYKRLSNEEVAAETKRLGCTVNNLAIIYSTDPMAKYLGFRHGDVIQSTDKHDDTRTRLRRCANV